MIATAIAFIATAVSYVFHEPLWLLPIEFVALVVLVMFGMAQRVKATQKRTTQGHAAGISTDLVAKRKTPDESALEVLVKLLPNKGAIMQLRSQQFWPRFEWGLDEPLLRFLQEDTGPEHGFLDGQLENLRQQLHEQVSLLMDRVYRYSESLPESSHSTAEDRRFRLLRKQDSEQIASYDARRNELYEAAKNVCRIYDDLVLTARRKFER